jgi:thymidylate synthase ThyX
MPFTNLAAFQILLLHSHISMPRLEMLRAGFMIERMARFAAIYSSEHRSAGLQ